METVMVGTGAGGMDIPPLVSEVNDRVDDRTKEKETANGLEASKERDKIQFMKNDNPPYEVHLKLVKTDESRKILMLDVF